MMNVTDTKIQIRDHLLIASHFKREREGPQNVIRGKSEFTCCDIIPKISDKSSWFVCMQHNKIHKKNIFIQVI